MTYLVHDGMKWGTKHPMSHGGILPHIRGGNHLRFAETHSTLRGHPTYINSSSSNKPLTNETDYLGFEL